jgi:hypothetical protein
MEVTPRISTWQNGGDDAQRQGLMMYGFGMPG